MSKSKTKIPMLGSGGTSQPIDNPYEVRSPSGLEGVFANEGDAEFHADELRRAGVNDVVVEHRKRPSYQARPTEKEWRAQMERDEAERLKRIAPRSPTPEQIYDRFHADRAAGMHYRDKHGNPAGTYVGYHGSHKHFTNWQDSARFARLGDFGIGMYFSTSSSDAAKHGHEVYRATIEFSNPLVVSSDMTPEMDRFRRAFKISDEDLQFADEGVWHAIIGLVNSLIEVGAASKQSVAVVLRKMGHDGIVVPNAVVRESRGNRDAKGDYIVVLDASSIKDWGPAFATLDEWRAAARNPSGRLFIGVYPTGIVYADRAREVDGDYMRVAFLPYSTLQLEWAKGTHPPELREEVARDAEKIIAMRGQRFPIDASGHEVTLGAARGQEAAFPYANPGRRNPAGLTAKGERMYEHIKAGYGGDPRAAEIASRTVAARAKDVPGLRNPPFVLPVPGQQIRSWDYGDGKLVRICEEAGSNGAYSATIQLHGGRRQVTVPLTRTEYDLEPRKLLERRTGFSRHEQFIGPPQPSRMPQGTPTEFDDTHVDKRRRR